MKQSLRRGHLENNDHRGNSKIKKWNKVEARRKLRAKLKRNLNKI